MQQMREMRETETTYQPSDDTLQESTELISQTSRDISGDCAGLCAALRGADRPSAYLYYAEMRG